MRKVDIPLMGWHVRAFCQIAQIAQITLVDHLVIVSDIDAIDFECWAFIDQIKQGREGVAEAHTASTTMTNIIDALEFFIETVFVPELWIVLI
jgi:hypothetical protein